MFVPIIIIVVANTFYFFLTAAKHLYYVISAYNNFIQLYVVDTQILSFYYSHSVYIM